MTILEITPRELAERMAAGTAPRLIDVREPFEWAICRLPGAELKPLGRIMEWMGELDPEQPVVLYCHTGMRSAQAAQYLTHRGFKQAINLRGGIDLYSVAVDPNVPRY